MFTLHQAPDHALVVRLVLEDLGLPDHGVLVDRQARGQKRPEYLALNPQGLIPVLETPDGPLFEAAAICLWLADRTGRMAPMPGDAGSGAFLGWLFFVSNTVHADPRMQFHPDRYSPDSAGAAPLHRPAALPPARRQRTV